MKDHIYRIVSHDFLSADQTQRRLDALKKRDMAATLAAIASLALMLFVHESSLGAVVLGPMIVFPVHLAIVFFIALAWLCVENYRKLQYNTAPGRKLEKVRPMLSDPAINEVVSNWTRQRPLQHRDVQVLLDSLPAWKLDKEAETFARSLERPTSSVSSAESAP